MKEAKTSGTIKHLSITSELTAITGMLLLGLYTPSLFKSRMEICKHIPLS